MKKNRRLHASIFPEIGTTPSRPSLKPPPPPNHIQTTIPFGPQFGGVVVKHRAKFEQPFNRHDVELETIFRLARTSQHARVDDLLAGRHPDDPLDLNRRMDGKNYQTPLFVAAYSKQLGMVKVLLKWNSDPNAADKLKRTPLHIAAVNDSVPICQAMLSAKADPDRRDKFRRTPLDVAVAKKSMHTAGFLKEWIEKRDKLLEQSAPKEAEDKSLKAQYPKLFAFLEGLGHLNLFPTLLALFSEDEEHPSMESLYNLEPTTVASRAGPDVLTRKQARNLWKAIPDEVIRQVQRTAAGW